MPSHVQTEDSSFIRDIHSKGLLNTNVAALTRHRRQTAKAKEHEQTAAKVLSLEAQLAAVTAQVDALARQMRG